MDESVADSRYQPLHHRLSESDWDRRGVRRQLVRDANAHLGYTSALLIDESGLAKKGRMSAGVARQWNGRLGKTDNCQVGVFAAVARGNVASLVDGERYLPEAWTQYPARCETAGIPEDRHDFRTKGEIALDIVRRLRREGWHFSFVGFDGGYGQLPWLLRELDGEGETFLAEVHSDQAIYLDDPAPAVPARRSSKGQPPRRLQTDAVPMTVADWAAAQPASDWRRLSARAGEKGEVMAEYLTQRVWVGDGETSSVHRWHLLVRREMDGTTLKFCLSNVKPQVSLRRLAEMQGARYFVEQSFKEAKSACGMAEYPVRRWQAWHHHRVLVMIATMFLAKERLALRDTAELLSCHDLVEIMRHKLPHKIVTDDDLATSIIARHQRRRQAMESAYQRRQLFSWHQTERESDNVELKAPEVGDIDMSLIHTCQLCRVNSFAYLQAWHGRSQAVLAQAARRLPWNDHRPLAGAACADGPRSQRPSAARRRQAGAVRVCAGSSAISRTGAMPSGQKGKCPLDSRFWQSQNPWPSKTRTLRAVRERLQKTSRLPLNDRL